MEFNHESVLLKECIDNLDIKEDGIYVDGTLGGAGHSKEILKKISSEGILIGIDRDKDALKESKKVLEKVNNNFKLVHGNFSDIKRILEKLNVKKIDGFLLDLGVSSYQIDNPKRGFSYMREGKLDMRMNQDQSLTAEKVINQYSYKKLVKIFFDYGEENHSKRIAKNIVNKRKEKKIKTTRQLVDVIKDSLPKKVLYSNSHPAKRIFQAVRIEVNNELGIIKDTIKDAVDLLKKDGKIVIITFHSLEDRIVKHTFKDLYNDCTCPDGMPICTCDEKKVIEIITKKPIYPSKKELDENSRSRSAKLRVAKKL